MIVIKYKEIVNGVLALSALRGDVTGRGDMLVDNDELALNEIIRTVVTPTLSNLGIAYVERKKSVAINDSPLTKHQLLHKFIALIMSGISGDNGGATFPSAFVGELPLLRGWS